MHKIKSSYFLVKWLPALPLWCEDLLSPCGCLSLSLSSLLSEKHLWMSWMYTCCVFVGFSLAEAIHCVRKKNEKGILSLLIFSVTNHFTCEHS